MRRRVGLFLFCGLVLPLIVTATASAQGAIMELTPKSGPPGTLVTATGSGFSAPNAPIGPPQLRFSTRDAEPIKPVTVVQGAFTDSFPIPAGVAPGEYLVIATQQTSRGAHVFGTPGRAKFQVTAGAAAAAVPPSRSASQATVALGGVLIALLLLAGGATAVHRRTSLRPLAS